MPTPDATIGKVSGWLPETIEKWNSERLLVGADYLLRDSEFDGELRNARPVQAFSKHVLGRGDEKARVYLPFTHADMVPHSDTPT